jgi:hypothetical protein
MNSFRRAGKALLVDGKRQKNENVFVLIIRFLKGLMGNSRTMVTDEAERNRLTEDITTQGFRADIL